MITSNYSISVNLYWRKTYIFVIKIKTVSYKAFTLVLDLVSVAELS
ncbi:hypothetical protein [Arsenophonus endosymbiont of Bemisia tabaci]|nr:hypothetical protein [Arsenophonus endosymbiont of Bemisia tabaci]